ncbi:MAG TPA: GGDEF domain-containing protein [Acidimicrobiales bacterium]|nr:GGDEF domain-containing protein [Acidimicrobiales bacterium]
MQDVDDGPRAGRRRLTAIPSERATPPAGRPRASVVPATRLLDVASALSDGATKLHARLRHLEPAERDALLDAVTEQVTVILGLWADLVRGVVSSDEPGPAPQPTEAGSEAVRAVPEAPPRAVGPRRSSHAGAEDGETADLLGRLSGEDVDDAADEFDGDDEGRDRARAAGDHPARVQGAAPVPAAPGPVVRRADVEEVRHLDRHTRDELTGVLNRNAGFSALHREIERARRSGERFVLGYLNVDGMKRVNDGRGPRAGDELLRRVTAALRATLRSYDVIARLGGDEFLFSLPGADLTTAELRFKEFAVILAEDAPGASASVGFAELDHEDTLDDLVAAAESAMLKGRRIRRRGRG